MRSARESSIRWRALLVVSTVLTIAAVSTFVLVNLTESAPTGTPAARWEYVALGDSYTSAPYVPPQTPGDPCLRSGANYPALLAADIPALDLTDVSCGGATTASMVAPQVLGTARLGAQFDALSEDTDLVTVGIGGNDSALFASLIYACFPAVRNGLNCHGASPRGDELQAIMDRVQTNVGEVLAGIARQAPGAKVIVVPYPQLITAGARCADRLPFNASDTAYIADVVQRLSLALITAAEDAGVEYVDVLAASRAHDICATDPWVMGSRTDVALAASFHPLPAGQRAVAELLREQVCEESVLLC